MLSFAFLRRAMTRFTWPTLHGTRLAVSAIDLPASRNATTRRFRAVVRPPAGVAPLPLCDLDALPLTPAG